MNRSKKLVTLALNKQLVDSIKEFNMRSRSSSAKRKREPIDEDYKPSASKKSNKIKIISNIVLHSGSLQNKSSISTDKFEDNITEYVTHELSKIVEFAVNRSEEKKHKAVKESELLKRKTANIWSSGNDKGKCDDVTYDNKTESLYDFVKIEVLNICNTAIDIYEKKNYTKKGLVRKRKKYNSSVEERKKAKVDKIKQEHAVISGCNSTCKKNCTKKISAERRKDINKQFWNMDNTPRKNFMLSSALKGGIKRKTTENSRRSNTIKYYLLNENGISQEVCKVFYLTTLGYRKTQDKTLRNILKTPVSSLTANKPAYRKKSNNNKIDRDIIIKHINSYHPTISHYRREHAPKRLYLPNDITIQAMYDDFKRKHPGFSFSYYIYREVVSSLNISFSRLGHEECWNCEKFKIHGQTSGHTKDSIDENCQECILFNTHRKKYTQSRKLYKIDSENQNKENIVVSADLEKVNKHWLLYVLKNFKFLNFR